MRIGLAAYAFRNNDLLFNLSQIEKGLRAAAGKVQLLCFGEAFLQGFGAFCWNYEDDRDCAISQDPEIMKKLCGLTRLYTVDLLFGYLEIEDETLYSSCAVIENGKRIKNYRRISKGWKESRLTDSHCREGADTAPFRYRGTSMTITLCGDLWDYPKEFKTPGLLIWPIYVNFDLQEWKDCEREYAEQAKRAARQTLMINSLSQKPRSHGGAFYFVDGEIRQKFPYDTEDILIVDL